MPRRRGNASPPGPTPSPKTVPGAGTLPLISHIHSASWPLGHWASSLSVRYRTALRPERLDAKALRCRDAQERLPHPARPLHQKLYLGQGPRPSLLTSTRRLSASASTSTSQSRRPRR